MKMYYVADNSNYYSAIFSTREKAEAWARYMLEADGYTNYIYYTYDKDRPDEYYASGYETWDDFDGHIVFQVEEYEVDDENW